MPDPDDLTPEAKPQGVTALRDAALRAAVVASFVMVVAALVRGHGDAWLLLWAAIAILAGVLVAGPKRTLGIGVWRISPIRSSWSTSGRWSSKATRPPTASWAG
jgi:two-component system phosphate regulon sensor histidine kinase PhoR